MSTNISSDLTDIADGITITINPAKLGPRQQAALLRMCRTGVVTQSSVTAALAKVMLEEKGHMSYVHIDKYGVSWKNIPVDEDNSVRRALIASAVLNQMDSKKIHVPGYVTGTDARDAYIASANRDTANRHNINMAQARTQGDGSMHLTVKPAPLSKVNFKYPFTKEQILIPQAFSVNSHGNLTADPSRRTQ
jgi:hypothetical protein